MRGGLLEIIYISPLVTRLLCMDTSPTSFSPSVVELLENRLDAALQIVAAFVLTDEEVEKAHPDARPGNLKGWAEEMKGDLLLNRKALVSALLKHGFPTNSHSGFPLTSLMRGPKDIRRAEAALQTLNRMLADYAEGKGEDVGTADFREHWATQLRKAKYSKVITEFALDANYGIYMAQLKRQDLKSNPKPE